MLQDSENLDVSRMIIIYMSGSRVFDQPFFKKVDSTCPGGMLEWQE